mmetsp:Transcript_40467/g.106843  ORF Transcript_40467/g.106843 Transcript_40467/m.106843 type:complete len:200 (-) Transcript_40467:90-689(-)
MGQLSPGLQLPSKEDRWRYCCHIEGEVPVELQLASARSTALEAQQHALAARGGVPWASGWPGAPGQVRSFPAVPPSGFRVNGPPQPNRPDDNHFPEVVRRRGGSRQPTQQPSSVPAVAEEGTPEQAQLAGNSTSGQAATPPTAADPQAYEGPTPKWPVTGPESSSPASGHAQYRYASAEKSRSGGILCSIGGKSTELKG